MSGRSSYQIVESFNGNLDFNVRSICRYLNLSQEEEVPMYAFNLDGKATTVRKRDCKIALLLGVLREIAEIVEVDEKIILGFSVRKIDSFLYTSEMREAVKLFYGKDLCDEATRTPNTELVSLRKLLLTVNFWITIDVIDVEMLGEVFDVLLKWKNTSGYLKEKAFLGAPSVLEMKKIARQLCFRGAISQLHPLQVMQEEILA